MEFFVKKTVQAEPMKPWQGILLGIIFSVIGIAVLFFAFSSIKTYNEKSKTFIETTSTVVDYEYDDDGLQAIVVEYVVDGQTYQKVSNSFSNMPKSIGTEVSIKYNPKNPKDAIWTTDSNNIILPIVGALFTLVGVAIIISNIKKGKKQNQLEEQNVRQQNELQNNINVPQQTNSVNQPSMNNFNEQSLNVNVNKSNSQNNNINGNM